MTVNGLVNGNSARVRPLLAGIYAPIPSFFRPGSEDLDLSSFEKHVAKVAAAGVGPLIAGSMGEAIHLSPEERIVLIRSARKVLDAAGLDHVPVIAGTGAASTRETLELTRQAANAGADYAIVIASGYFAGALSRQALKDYWTEVADKSPIPVIIYNYPGASSGIDLDSDLIIELATTCPNVCGVKLTCGNVGKLTRIAEAISEPSFTAKYPRKNPAAPFLVLGGFADFLLPAAFVEGHGAIIGLANLAPYSTAKVFQLAEEAKGNPAVLTEARRIQGIVARADFTIAKASIAGTKYLLERVYGYGGLPRRPLPPIASDAATAVWEHPHTQALVKLERELSGKLVA